MIHHRSIGLILACAALHTLYPSTATSGENAPIVEALHVEDSSPRPQWMIEHAAEFEASARRATTFLFQGRICYRDASGRLVGADNVRVRAMEVSNGDLCLDGVLATQWCDQDGYFSIEATHDPGPFCGGDTPDLQVKFRFENDVVQCFHPDGILAEHMVSRLYPDYTNPVLDIGTVVPPSERRNDELHIFTLTERAVRWMGDQGEPLRRDSNLGLLQVLTPRVLYSDALDRPTHVEVGSVGEAWNGSEWVPFTTLSLRIRESDRWNDFVITRLLCEQWIARAYLNYDEDLCNSTCDGFAGGCSYCTWCSENAAVAFHKGLAEWMSSEILAEYPTRYGDTPTGVPDFEGLGDCGGTYENPLITPGAFAAVLHDIVDTLGDSHPEFPAGRDMLDRPAADPMYLARNYKPTSPAAFLNDFVTEWPEDCEALWFTAANAGYDTDLLPPNAIGVLSSPTHAVGVESPNDRLTVNWIGPNDGCFDTKMYSVRLSTSGPAQPDAIAELGNVTSYTTNSLSPGAWYLNLRVADAAGNWRSDYSTYGPVIIRDPIPANLTHVDRSGWVARVVPRAAADVTPYDAPAPIILTGNQPATYWNSSISNLGDNATLSASALWVLSDGSGFYNPIDPVQHDAAVPELPGLSGYAAMNRGPIQVSGGRHTFGAWADFTGVIAEISETDNDWATQWIWTPYELSPNGSTFRLAPPPRAGGWDAAAGQSLYYNCDGLRFAATGWWNALTLVPESNEVDYDARLHVASTGADDGFAENVGWSARPAGCLDAVFVNRNQTGAESPWDVGIIRADDEVTLAGYDARHITSVLQAYGDSLEIVIPAHHPMAMREVYFDTTDLGWSSAVARLQGSGGPVHLLWLHRDLVTGDMDDNSASAVSDAAGVARVDLNFTDEGFHCFAVYRDPKDGPLHGPITITFEVNRTPPDFQAAHPPGWAGAVVPRATKDGEYASVPSPTFLVGWAEETYLNLATANDSPASVASQVDHEVRLDGATIYAPSKPGYGAFEDWRLTDATQVFVRGGRHTLTLRTDAPDVFEEITELNNRRGAQWGWSGMPIPLGVTLGRPQPPDPFGGWGDLQDSDPGFNSDGYRTPNFTPGENGQGTWAAIAAVPGDSSDVNLLLHRALDDPSIAFDEVLAGSSVANDGVDYLLVDLFGANLTQFDVGVTHQSGSQGFQFDVVTSTSLGTDPTGTHGVFTLAADDLVDLYEVELSNPYLRVRLINRSTANLGLNIHSETGDFQGRPDRILPGLATDGGAGADDWITVEIANAGRHVIAVWKNGSADAPTSADYELDFLTVTSAPDADAVRRNGIVSIQPNPFNPRTTVHFEIRESSDVQLSIFNVRGERVRTLVQDHRGAGRHEAVWDGTDDSGQRVASGVYHALLHGVHVQDRKKLVLVK